MRELLVMRHAKSDWDAGAGDDLARPLAERGRAAAARLGRFLSAAGHAPGLAVCSPAARARETLEIAAVAGAWECAREVVAALYGGGVEGVVEAIRSIPDEQERVLLVGHEPVWSELVAHLVGGGAVEMPTAAVASVAFAAGGWAEVGEGRGTLSWLVNPRLLKRLQLE